MQYDYIQKVQPGLSRMQAHLWHVPFWIEEIYDDFRVKLKVKDKGYRVNHWVHVSRLKPSALFPRRPTAEITLDEKMIFDWQYCLKTVGNLTTTMASTK